MGRSSRRPQPPRAVDHQLLDDPPPPKLPPPPENPPLLLLLHPPPELDPPPPAQPTSPGCRGLVCVCRGGQPPRSPGREPLAGAGRRAGVRSRPPRRLLDRQQVRRGPLANGNLARPR